MRKDYLVNDKGTVENEIMKERLLKSALKEFPWGGTTKSRQELKGKTLLYLLFKDPSYYYWSMQKARNDSRFLNLFKEMNFLIQAIKTILPIAKCSGGKRVAYWSIYEGRINGHFTTCSDDECLCKRNVASKRSTIVPYTFWNMFQFIKGDIYKRIFLSGYKLDFGLPPRYSEEKYLKWLLDKVIFDHMRISA